MVGNAIYTCFTGPPTVVIFQKNPFQRYNSLFNANLKDDTIPFFFDADELCAKRRTDGTVRTVYYLANFTGDLEEVASSLLDKWRCWFTKDISTKSWRDYTFLPDWDERFGDASNSSLWILLRIGSKIWPVHVIHNQFGHGWADFWADNELRSGFKLVFGCERSWIFDVVVLMTHLEPLYFHWSTTMHEFQESSLMPFMIDDLGTPRHLRTSCFPSTMSTKENIMQFRYYCGSGKCMFKVFGKQFRDFFRYAGADAHEVHLHMRNRWWGISIIPRVLWWVRGTVWICFVHFPNY
ncbi:hypothetical protein RHMOL_Rhmol05G0069000 [Rhododendron molle]|uniref:Uncharacterized protein n=1 Tax=Rhododendron molle TaxID=49168 RepID=A0ACC0NLH5_RHOML|nr:hypothetical protein RHMOL_Rhmol05G0069000 [Rhododendron molle]